MNMILLSVGAVAGAVARWQLGLWFNPFLAQFAFGTLLTNWLGCFLIGVAMGLNLGNETRLFVITGFLGSFTTFSSFSAEISEKLLVGKWLTALGILSFHLIGGILLTLLGILFTRYWGR
ncbi:chromosome condensation protein CrcB [Nicoletella semolina]|nr:CrcB family protein [Nicoletella semolina]MDH2924632.1 chromosome condensation protein CrcB [Nicoletella semolina]